MMRSGNIFEREGSRGHGCDGDGTEITGGGDYSGWDKMYDPVSYTHLTLPTNSRV